MNIMKILFFAILGLMIIVGAVLLLSKPGGQPETPLNASNGTANGLGIARWGDNVTLDYWLYGPDGMLLDTSDKASAQEGNIYLSYRQYSPLNIVLNSENGMIQGFTNGILGAVVGEKKRFEVQPADGYGESDPSLVWVANRTNTLPRIANVSKVALAMSGLNASVNASLRLDQWDATVIAVENDTVTLRMEPVADKLVELYGMPARVSWFNDTHISFTYEPKVNGTYLLADSSTGTQQSFMVTAMDNESVTVDFNHPLAGKVLTFDVIVRSIN